MKITLILLLFLSLLLSVSIAYFQYYFREKYIHKFTPVLFILKTISLFLILALLINPSFEKEIYQNEKPVLALLKDNSASIAFFKESENVTKFHNSLKNNSNIQDKFDIQNFRFGKSLEISDSVTFSEGETNIYDALFKVNALHAEKIAPQILLTDGNQTIGLDYEFINTKQPIYPVVFGDTTLYADVKITQINANKYSFLGNKFPVEVFLNYEGKEKVSTVFKITTNGKTIFSQNVFFSPEKKSTTITTTIESLAKGTQFYNVSIQKITGEKNTNNNSKDFSVEVIDEQSNILIVTSVLHPDIGMLKKSIENNKQRKVSIEIIDDFKSQIKDYQLIVLYQINAKFSKIISEIKSNNLPFLFISGANTDWNFVNNQQLGFRKKAINQTENYNATFNNSYPTFVQNNINFDNFPPLKDAFGDVFFDKEYQTLLYQNINGIETKMPLFATVDVDNEKFATIFGEGIWKWRAASFLNNNSFEDFDAFIGNLIGYLATNKKRDRLEVQLENLIPANTTLPISAFYYDKTYKFDARASLEITITNQSTKAVQKLPFSVVENAFQVMVDDLSSGIYEYKVAVLGENLSKTGRFAVSDYQIETQFTRANVEKLAKIAQKSGGKLFYKDQLNELIKELSTNSSFYTVQKSSKKELEILDWKWVLFLIVGLLSAEWFLRKYIGKL